PRPRSTPIARPSPIRRATAECPRADMAVDIKAFGAVGNGEADDTPALERWYAAIPDGGVGFLSQGHYRFTRTLKWNRQVSVVGEGPNCALKPDVGPLADGVVLNDTPRAVVGSIWLDNFAVLNDSLN